MEVNHKSELEVFFCCKENQILRISSKKKIYLKACLWSYVLFVLIFLDYLFVISVSSSQSIKVMHTHLKYFTNFTCFKMLLKKITMDLC